MAPILLASIHPTKNWENAYEQNKCSAPLISDYSNASKCLLARECNTALEQYVPYIAVKILTSTFHPPYGKRGRGAARIPPNRSQANIDYWPAPHRSQGGWICP